LNKKLTIYWIKIGGLSASPDRLAHVDHITISFVLPFLSLSLSLSLPFLSLSLKTIPSSGGDDEDKHMSNVFDLFLKIVGVNATMLLA
jgi:hypothetical protein